MPTYDHMVEPPLRVLTPPPFHSIYLAYIRYPFFFFFFFGDDVLKFNQLMNNII
jgi:hypothetical protein